LAIDRGIKPLLYGELELEADSSAVLGLPLLVANLGVAVESK